MTSTREYSRTPTVFPCAVFRLSEHFWNEDASFAEHFRWNSSGWVFPCHLKKNQSSSVVFLKSRTFTYLYCQIKGSATMASDPCVPSAPSLVQCHAKIHLPVFTQDFHYECDSLGKDVRLLCTLIANKGLHCLWEIFFLLFPKLKFKNGKWLKPGQ